MESQNVPSPQQRSSPQRERPFVLSVSKFFSASADAAPCEVGTLRRLRMIALCLVSESSAAMVVAATARKWDMTMAEVFMFLVFWVNKEDFMRHGLEASKAVGATARMGPDRDQELNVQSSRFTLIPAPSSAMLHQNHYCCSWSFLARARNSGTFVEPLGRAGSRGPRMPVLWPV